MQSLEGSSNEELLVSLGGRPAGDGLLDALDPVGEERVQLGVRQEPAGNFHRAGGVRGGRVVGSAIGGQPVRPRRPWTGPLDGECAATPPASVARTTGRASAGCWPAKQ